ncbi:P-loop containing nucleoside triphosphate hydrolase protein [Aspergillus unguis]
MPSLSSVPQRRRRTEEDDESDDSASSLDSRSPSANPPSSSSKRPRLETTATAEPESSGSDAESDDDNDDDDESATSSSIQTNGQTQSRSQTASQGPSRSLSIGQSNARKPGNVTQDGYKPGAIVRIKVTDFVTYTSAEFFPGPKLNMVIGPNGTGKSTLVCAICLGLGWGPQHLGRAKDPGEFVKHGCREATIEIELAGGPKHASNPIITRTIRREGSRSTFTINGTPSNMKQVLKLAQSFAIQVDNLCQFLPQDKVSEFAALTPVELLNSTQRAAAGAEMVELHENLKTLRTEQKNLQSNHQADTDMLANLEHRQEMQRPDVERVRQRTQIQRKIDILEAVRPLVMYKHVYAQYEAAKADKDASRQELQELEAELAPMMQSVNEKKAYCSQLIAVIKHKERAAEAADRTATDLGKRVKRHEQKMKDLDNEIEAERKSAQKSRQEGSKITQQIKNLQRQIDEEPVHFDPEWYNEQIRDKRREQRDLETKGNELSDRRRALQGRINEIVDRMKDLEQQLRSLDSAAGQQERKLHQVSQDSLRAYQWLMKNQDKFEKEVFGPPVITCSIKDPRYADHVESLLQKTDFTAFTVQTRNDFRTLQRALNRDMRLHDITIKTSSIPLESLRPPASGDELRNLGFQGWAVDFLDGPEPVLAMLCSEKLLHQTPVSLRDISDQTYSTLETGSITSWVAGKSSYQIIRRREYGPGASSTRVRQVKPARCWTSQPVDVSAKRELQGRIQELKSEMEAGKEQQESLTAEHRQCNHERENVARERDELEREKAVKQSAYTTFRAIPEKLAQLEAKKESLEANFEKIKVNVTDIRDKQGQESVKKAEAVIAYADAVEELRELQEEVIKLTLWKVEGVSDITTLEERNIDHKTRLDAKADEVKQKTEELKEMTKQVQKYRNESKLLGRRTTTETDLGEFARQMAAEPYSPDQLETEIDSEKARLELTHAGSGNVVQEFEERGRQIERLRGKLSDFETRLAEFTHAINEVRGKWEPKLDSIVKSVSDAFSDSFARIGCAGQVSLDKAGDEPGPDGQPSGNDFDQWSIQVHVKFREHENLSLLDSHRQSGGERAVSTIFYLMALQSLSASPFRVVDEINQGMDPRNERMVHGRLVDIACAPAGDGSGGGQYFLITPKLLSGLAYKPGMRVLCIVSGEHMPEDHTMIDFGNALRRKRALALRTNGRGGGIERSVSRSVAA